MRLKVTMSRDPKHDEAVVGVGWLNTDEIISCGDDQKILRWNLRSAEAHILAQLPKSCYPTSLSWPSKKHSDQSPSDVFIVSSTEGKFYVLNRSGSIEKVVEAHKGATLCVKWSFDGSSLLSCGEDGSVKMWSRNGMLRSILSQNSSPVYRICWNSDDSLIAYCCGFNCFIKSLKTQVSPIKWKAHDGVVLCIDWSNNTNLIVTGGEDCKYKVWDNYGRPIFSSSSHCYPITSLSWNIDGNLFVVGSYNLMRLCDKSGWSHSLEMLNTGSIYAICWSLDSTQLVAACANGHVLHCQVNEKSFFWKNLEVVQSQVDVILLHDVTSDTAHERLEFRDRVTKLALGFDHLIATTNKHCHIYRFFLLVDGTTIQTYSFEGRVQCILKIPGVSQSYTVNEKSISLSNYTIGVCNRSDPRNIHLFETTTAKPLEDCKITHSHDVVELAVDQCGMITAQRFAFIDVNYDCFIVSIGSHGLSARIAKIGKIVSNIVFNDTSSILVGLQENKLIIWTQPSVAFIDKELLTTTTIIKEIASLGRSPQILFFVGSHLSLCRSDGSVISCGIPPYPAILSSHMNLSKWDSAIKLCWKIKEDYLWAMMAATAVDQRNFPAAEIAYGVLNEIEKMNFVRNLQSLKNINLTNAAICTFQGNIAQAELVLLQNREYFQAIMLNIHTFNWQRALEIAIKQKMHVDTVIGYRQKFLHAIDSKESNKLFLQLRSEKTVSSTLQTDINAEILNEIAKLISKHDEKVGIKKL